VGDFTENCGWAESILVGNCDERTNDYFVMSSSSSSLARQPLVGPDLLKKLCPFVSVEGDLIPILDL
jgi:hypothetical protein